MKENSEKFDLQKLQGYEKDILIQSDKSKFFTGNQLLKMDLMR